MEIESVEASSGARRRLGANPALRSAHATPRPRATPTQPPQPHHDPTVTSREGAVGGPRQTRGTRPRARRARALALACGRTPASAWSRLTKRPPPPLLSCTGVPVDTPPEAPVAPSEGSRVAQPRDDEMPARSVASEEDLVAVQERLRAAAAAACVGDLRFSQARHLAALQGGEDAILIGATGSGKSATMFLPALADLVDAVSGAVGDVDNLRPVDLFVIPMANIGSTHEAAFNAYARSAVGIGHRRGVLGRRHDRARAGRAGGSRGHGGAAARRRALDARPGARLLLWPRFDHRRGDDLEARAARAAALAPLDPTDVRRRVARHVAVVSD